MKKTLQENTYRQLVEDITELYDCARHALVEAYWQIGKRIVEQEQQGDDTPEYGARLLERLFEDLQHKPGRGFSISNLRNMRRFYLDNRIHQAPGELNWLIIELRSEQESAFISVNLRFQFSVHSCLFGASG